MKPFHIASQVILIEGAEMRPEPILNVLGVALDEAMHGLTLRTGLLGVEHMAVLQFDNVASLHAVTALEHHEVRFRTGEIQGGTLLDLALAGEQHALGHDFLFEENVEVGDVRRQGCDHRFELGPRRDHGGLNLAGQLAQFGVPEQPLVGARRVSRVGVPNAGHGLAVQVAAEEGAPPDLRCLQDRERSGGWVDHEIAFMLTAAMSSP